VIGRKRKTEAPAEVQLALIERPAGRRLGKRAGNHASKRSKGEILPDQGSGLQSSVFWIELVINP
jgi:hypothetical protein